MFEVSAAPEAVGIIGFLVHGSSRWTRSARTRAGGLDEKPVEDGSYLNEIDFMLHGFQGNEKEYKLKLGLE